MPRLQIVPCDQQKPENAAGHGENSHTIQREAVDPDERLRRSWPFPASSRPKSNTAGRYQWKFTGEASIFPALKSWLRRTDW